MGGIKIPSHDIQYEKHRKFGNVRKFINHLLWYQLAEFLPHTYTFLFLYMQP